MPGPDSAVPVKGIAQGILDRGADCVLAVKHNQGVLHDDLKELFEEAGATGFEGAARRPYPARFSQSVRVHRDQALPHRIHG